MNASNENSATPLCSDSSKTFFNIPVKCCAPTAITRRTFIKRSGGATIATLIAFQHASAAVWGKVDEAGVSYYCCVQGSFDEAGTMNVGIPDFSDKIKAVIAQQLASDVTAPSGWTKDGAPTITLGSLTYESNPMPVNYTAVGQFTGQGNQAGDGCSVTAEITEVSGETDTDPISFTAKFPIKKDGTIVTSEIVVSGVLSGKVTADLADGDDPVAKDYACVHLALGSTPSTCDGSTSIDWAVGLKLRVESDDETTHTWSWSAYGQSHSGTWDVGGSAEKNVEVSTPAYSVSDTCGPAY